MTDTTRPASAHARIAFGALAVGASTIAVKGVVLVREIQVAHAYGRGDALEAFVVALILPLAIGGAIGGALHQVLTPMCVQERQRAGEAAEAGLFAASTALTILLALAAALVVGCCSQWLLPVLAGGFAPEKLEATRRYLLLALPLCVTGVLFPAFSAVLHAHGRFTLAALAPAMTPALTIVAIALASDITGYPLVIAAVAGAVCECLLLALALPPAARAALLRPFKAVGTLGPLLAQLAPVLGSLVFQFGTSIIDQSTAARVAPGGGVSGLSYALRVVGLPMGLMAAALAVPVLPVLGGQVDRPAEFWATLHRWQRVALWGGLGLAVLLGAVAHPLIRLVLEHGSFGPSDTDAVAAMIVAMSGAIPFYVTGLLAVKALSALGLNRYILVLAAVNLCADAASNLILAPRFGLVGVAAATTIVYFVSCVQAQAILARHRRATIGAAPR